jgi:hypothetical protein
MVMFYKFWNSLEKPLAIQNPAAEDTVIGYWSQEYSLT